jgi:hypothetical protein
MTILSVKAFNGLKPIVRPHLLQDTDAQVAQNVRLVSGAIEPMRGTTTLKSTTTSNPKTIFRYGSSATETNYWLEFVNDTDVMRSPIPNDQYDRLYWADGVVAPRYAPNSMILSGSSYPGASYQLGIPAPAAPSITAYTETVDNEIPESRTYVVTYVSAYGEEGPPSDASAVVALNPNQNVTVSLPGAPGGSYNITLKRIYRSSTVGTSAQFQYVDEIPVAQATYVDSISQGNLGEVLPSEGWVAPPANLKGLRMMANGAAVGFAGRTVYLSEPNMPHAWPHKYTIDFDIVGIATYGQTVAVLTTAFPFLLQGADPSAMTPTKIEVPQACTSKRGIIETGDGVLYPSPDGYVSLGTGIDVITKGLFSREQWQAYNPSSMDAYLYNGRIHLLYNNGTRGILIIDASGQGAVLTTCTYNQYTPMTAGYYDPTTDTLYLAQNASIMRFDRGSLGLATWRSKRFRLPWQQNMGVGQVRAGTYPVYLRVYADGTLRIEKTVTSDEPFMLPSGFRALEWEFEIDAGGEVSEVNIATSMAELKQV